MQNLIAAIFDVESEGYQAITNLKNTPATDDYTIVQMALVKREDGKVSVCDTFDSGISTADDTLLGGLLGSMIGVLGGPVGMLLMGSYGAMTGSILDLDDAISDTSLIEKVADKLQDGTVALVALATEQNETGLDQVLNKYKVEIHRYDANVIQAEVEEANKMQAEMERQARAKLRQTKVDEIRKKIGEKYDKLTSDFEDFTSKLEI